MQDDSRRRTNEERSAEMRQRLIVAGRALFVEKGFAGAGTPEIVAHARVTRGALYHHFADKTALFRAVAEAEAGEVASEIEAGSIDAADPRAALIEGAAAYFRAMAAPGRARILLIDGPVVLGPEGMDALDAGTGRATLVAGLAARWPDLDEATRDSLAVVLSAGFDRAALAVAGGSDAAPFLSAFAHLFRHTD